MMLKNSLSEIVIEAHINQLRKEASHYSLDELLVFMRKYKEKAAEAAEAERVLSPLLADVMRCSAWHWFQNQNSVKAALAFVARKSNEQAIGE